MSTELELKGGLYPLTTVRLYTLDCHALKKQLEDKINQAPKFFDAAPIVLDVSQCILEKNDDLLLLLNTVRQAGLIPIGVIPPPQSESLVAAVRASGVAILSKTLTKAAPEPTPTVEETPLPTLSPTRTITQPVRSGQQIYAAQGDLLVLSAVSHGAEILADGHIHVYGPLRGRALAGISGEETAHIFCQSLEAELVSIAGRYKISEDLKDNPLWGKPARLFLEQGKLQIAPLY